MFKPAERHLNKYEDVKLTYPDTMANTEENYKDKPDWVRAQRNRLESSKSTSSSSKPASLTSSVSSR